MTDAGSEVRSFIASDGYPLHVGSGRPWAVRADTSWCCTEFRVMGVGTTGSGARSRPRATPPRFPIAGVRGPTPAIGATPDRRAG